MKIVNGIAQFEEVKCWRCEGEGYVRLSVNCSQHHRMLKRECKECGKPKGTYTHLSKGGYTQKCPNCDGIGTRLEDRFDSDYQHVIATLPIEIVTSENQLTWIESYIGINTILSVTDYGRHWKMSDEEFLNMIKKELSEGYHQYCKYITEDNKVADAILVTRKQNGYTLVASNRICQEDYERELSRKVA